MSAEDLDLVELQRQLEKNNRKRTFTAQIEQRADGSFWARIVDQAGLVFYEAGPFDTMDEAGERATARMAVFEQSIAELLVEESVPPPPSAPVAPPEDSAQSDDAPSDDAPPAGPQSDP